MHRRLLSVMGLIVLAQLALSATGLPSASADSGMTVALGQPTLTSRLLVTVPVTVVCDPLSDPTYSDDVYVSIQQASGRSVSTGSGRVDGGPQSMGPSAPVFTCDGTTQNAISVSVVPDIGSSPFHGGPAIFQVYASHSAGTCSYYCVVTATESGHVGPISVNLKG